VNAVWLMPSDCESLWGCPLQRGKLPTKLLHSHAASGHGLCGSRGFFKAFSDRLKGVPPPVY